MNEIEKEVTLSSKYQVVIPKEAREMTHLEAGDKLLLTISAGGQILLWKKPKNYTAHMKGLGKELWRGININQYVKTLRKEWN
ncbi:hypothetical protein A2276_08030 [candidate division WOR-1 bacterium RIFOXYA12_FULL_43_27]|uniref:SpoVT-AbrB domain-containing protein n=1 Tax=candidate division WOR-1 bacterium RIFOXYC2_FULL_46_14 TaxID=1802587 RepID=A0A1F4U613_UNCSA|nr:MAG: hypothetical protein A2276_08030 [candidate division WOR-1 bacterium RIFOXYA12_FULL_43_27]OGC20544.1 MAG: hypothetical protein A2292_05855 [candidate division WOR-1 bacterium RIFOXYB2_FULL_46_45]OGC31719.1 MAG: hypothetical protein A2232_05595 [candidate division WOR-1 bacterium RIFOXYA2_FULL_46_56]OGC40386.1 MAG: hypothetical protein A2438_03885 [candidate division WOR-1 bacterium RIFOXYC2_FULL_46_14]